MNVLGISSTWLLLFPAKVADISLVSHGRGRGLISCCILEHVDIPRRAEDLTI